MNSLNYEKIFRGLTAIGILILVLLPHVVIGLVVEILHLLLEWIIEFGHIVFEWVEIALDTVIELMFETELHDTQIIVFYIIMGGIGFALYRMSLFIPGKLRRFRDKVIAYCLGQKNRLSLHWQSLTVAHKAKWIAIMIAVGYWYVFLSF